MKGSCTLLMAGVIALAALIHCIATQADEKKKVCVYLDQQFNVGDLVTGNKCDRCFCTQYGIMCEMIKCEVPQCLDAVMGECCMECPNGRNCLHEGENMTVIVPETGCLYSDGDVCQCDFEDNIKEGMTRCLPGGDAPLCKPYLP